MNFKQNQSKRKIFIISLAIILALGLTFIGVYVGALKKPIFGWPEQYAQNEQLNEKDIDTDAPTDEEKQAGNQAKTNTIEENDQQASESPSPSTNPLQITMTANGQNGDTYQLRYLLDNAITSGTCKLTLTKGTQTVTQEASVQVLGGSTTCAGFNIQMSSLSSGDWKATTTVTSGDRTGTNTETISI